MGGESELVKARIALITEIQKLGDSLRVSAESAALSAVRMPQNKDTAARARECVVMHDERNRMADEMIKLVWKYWPRDPD